MSGRCAALRGQTMRWKALRRAARRLCYAFSCDLLRELGKRFAELEQGAADETAHLRSVETGDCGGLVQGGKRSANAANVDERVSGTRPADARTEKPHDVWRDRMERSHVRTSLVRA